MSELPSIHKNALKNTLDALEVSFEEFTEAVLETGSANPAEILGLLLDKKAEEVGLNIEQAEAAVEILEASLTFDEGTGAYDRKHRPLIEAAGDVIASNTDTDVYKVQIDLSNMGGANDAIGRKNVDDLVRIITDMYEAELGYSSEVIVSRDGGDEIGFVVVLGEEEDIESTINKAQDKVERLVAEAGLDSLIHLKYPDIPERRGFSAGAGYAPLGIGLDEEEIQKNIDIGIELEKLERGKERLIHSQEEYERNNNSRLLPSDFHYHEPDNPEEIERRKENLKEAEIVIGDYGGVEDFYNDLRDVSEWPEDIFPTSRREGYDLENPETLRLEAVINKAEDLELELEQVLLFSNLTELYDERDSLTGLKGARDFINDVTRFNESDVNSVLSVIEVENLSGLNEEKGHYASDVVISEASKIVESSISEEYGENQSNNMYHIGAGRIAVLLPLEEELDSASVDKEQEKLSKVISGAAKEFAEKVNIDDVKDIAHPKNNNIVGTGLEYVTIELEKDKSAEEHMRDLDIIREYAGNKGMNKDDLIKEVKKDNVDRRTFEAAWTIASRGEAGRIERSLGKDEEREGKSDQEEKELADKERAGYNKARTRRLRPRFEKGYSEAIKAQKKQKENKDSEKNNENER